MPKVSIIIPTYNREEYICETVQSVLNQSYKDIEIVVVDDGSKDNTLQKLGKFERSIKIITQKNSERAISRNHGAKVTSGEYLSFLDSDDLWERDKLKKQIEILDNNKDFILVYGKCLRVNQARQEIKSKNRQLQGYSGNVFENLLMRNFITSPTPLIRREYFNKTNGFESRYIPYEDWEFWIRFSMLGKFYFLPVPLAYYRIHPQQSVKLAEAEKIETVTTLLLESSFNLKEVPSTTKNKSLGLANLRFSYWYLLANQINDAKEKIRKAKELYPKFILDLRWHGLNLICNFPRLKDKWFFDLEQYH